MEFGALNIKLVSAGKSLAAVAITLGAPCFLIKCCLVNALPLVGNLAAAQLVLKLK